MKRILPVLLAVLAGLIACKDKKQSTQETIPEQKPAAIVANPAQDSAEIRNVITGFYNWYTANDAKFMAYNLYSGIKKKDAPPYKINWDEVTKYQGFIRGSVPQLGEEFIRNQTIFFRQCDSAFKVDTQDDVPYGFDYDWYTNSQEDPKYLLDEITKGVNWWDIVVKGDEATVNIKGFHDHPGKQEAVTFISLGMKKENGKWTIAKIIP